MLQTGLSRSWTFASMRTDSSCHTEEQKHGRVLLSLAGGTCADEARARGGRRARCWWGSWTFTSMHTDGSCHADEQKHVRILLLLAGVTFADEARVRGAGAPGAGGRARLHDVQARAGQRDRAAAHVALGAGGAAPRLTRRPTPYHPGLGVSQLSCSLSKLRGWGARALFFVLDFPLARHVHAAFPPILSAQAARNGHP